MKRTSTFTLMIEIGTDGEPYVNITGVEGLRRAIELAQSQPTDRRGMVLGQVMLGDYEAEEMETYSLPAHTAIMIEGAFIPHEAAVAFRESLLAVPEPAPAPAPGDGEGEG